MSNGQSSDGTERFDNLVLTPLAILHNEGWGPDAVEIDREAGEVKFVFTHSVNSATDQEDSDD